MSDRAVRITLIGTGAVPRRRCRGPSVAVARDRSTAARGRLDEAARAVVLVSADRGVAWCSVLDIDRHGRPVASARRRRGTASGRCPLWQELPLLLVVAFCLAVLIRTFLLQAFFIPSGSMEDTLLVGDRVLVNKVVYDVRDPAAGRGRRLPGHRQLGAGEPGRRRPAPVWPDRPHPRRPGRGEPAGREGLHQAGHRPARRPGLVLRRPRAGSTSTACRSTSRTSMQNSPLDVPPTPGCAGPARFDEVVVPPGQLFVMGDHRHRLAGLPLPGPGADRQRDRPGVRDRLAERRWAYAAVRRTRSARVPAAVGHRRRPVQRRSGRPCRCRLGAAAGSAGARSWPACSVAITRVRRR